MIGALYTPINRTQHKNRGISTITNQAHKTQDNPVAPVLFFFCLFENCAFQNAVCVKLNTTDEDKKAQKKCDMIENAVNNLTFIKLGQKEEEEEHGDLDQVYIV